MGGRLLIGVFVSLAACLPSEDLKTYSDGSMPASAGAMPGEPSPDVDADVGMSASAAPPVDERPVPMATEVAPGGGERPAPAALDPGAGGGEVQSSSSTPTPVTSGSEDASSEDTSSDDAASEAVDEPIPTDASAPPVDAQPEPVETPVPPPRFRYIRFVSDAAVQGPYTAVAEFNVLDGAGQPIERTGWVATADSEEVMYAGGARALLAIDGAPASLWHTAWFNVNPPPAHPHTLELDMGAAHEVSGFRYLGRQDDSRDGRVSRYRFFVSADAIEWGEPAASGTLENTTAEQEVRLVL